MQNDPRYIPVAAALPEVLPAITQAEARRAIGRIMRRFGGVSLGGPSMTAPARWKRPARVCWTASKPTRGHLKGWGRLIHDAAHIIFAKRHPTFRPHDGGHATLEREIAQYVVEQGFLTGTLQPAKKSKRIAPDARLAKIDASIKRWKTKFRRADTALSKLARQRKALVRRIETANPQPTPVQI